MNPIKVRVNQSTLEDTRAVWSNDLHTWIDTLHYPYGTFDVKIIVLVVNPEGLVNRFSLQDIRIAEPI